MGSKPSLRPPGPKSFGRVGPLLLRCRVLRGLELGGPLRLLPLLDGRAVLADVLQLDAAPAVSGAPAPAAAPPTTEAVRAAGGAPLSKSAWNTKDTWEEVDVTSWAVERIAELFMGAPLPLYDGDLRLRIYDVRRVVGHAQVVIFQRKVRSIFDLEEVELSWVAEDGGEGQFKGAATLRGFANSADAGDLEISTNFVTKTETHEAVKTFLRNEGGARAQLAQLLADFEREFTQLTGDGVALARSFEKSGRLRDPAAEANSPEVREARLAAAKRQAFQDDMRISNPKLKVTM